MIKFFKTHSGLIAVETTEDFGKELISALCWLFGGAEPVSSQEIKQEFIGPRKEMITPWSTNAVEITQNMGISGIRRMEEFFPLTDFKGVFDPMLQARYNHLGQDIFLVEKIPDEIIEIEDIAAYNKQEGLALSDEEIEYLNKVSNILGRKLTDSEVFGFSQVNSEHCRHKIFNGNFIIDGEEKKESLFELIKKTSKLNPNFIVSAYKDNVAFINGPGILEFAPETQYKPDFFRLRPIETVISLKAETHNFPTTVEPFNGAATGSGGEIRDRMAGGKASIPLAGTAVYMTSFSRLENNREWEKSIPERKWLYHTPADILVKASNGASDFGNKFGQPLICGSLLTFEHVHKNIFYGYDKVIMLAGGIGYGNATDSKKDSPGKSDKIVMLGGDNYRIGMGGGAVSSVSTGEYSSNIELNAIQRSNPEMQKRVYNAIRAMAESDSNPVISIHDHGAGGHLNCFSELVESSGGKIDIDRLPIGDSTLSDKEIIGNESQERMGLVIHEGDLHLLQKLTERERAPMYLAGEITGDQHFSFLNSKTGKKPIDLPLGYLFGNPPKTIIKDQYVKPEFEEITYKTENISLYAEQLLAMEAVACKDWLTNKVDRSVTGRIAKQQCCGRIQLPLNNLGIAATGYTGFTGIATSIGHAPVAMISDPAAGARLSVAEALTNLVWTPLTHGMKGVSLSANWMWPCKNPGEDARLYNAVKAVSEFAIELGINIPTGKDSLSMTQKYPGGKTVLSPGTVIISAVAEVSDFRKTVEPVLVNDMDTYIIHVDFSGKPLALGGSSFSVLIGKPVNKPADVDPVCFKTAFNAVQELIQTGMVMAGHDISSGGLLTSLLEMNFANSETGMNIDFSGYKETDLVKILFSENPGVILQVKNKEEVLKILDSAKVKYQVIGKPIVKRELKISQHTTSFILNIDNYRDSWYRTSWLLDKRQAAGNCADLRFQNYKKQELNFKFPDHFKGTFKNYGIDPARTERTGIRAAIIREKGVNGDREMAYAMYLAGFEVKDVHMTDLISGRENLEEINFIVFVGGFSNSDVLGSAKGWAGAFLYNEKAKAALDNFYMRKDTISLGICNGCQVMIELGLVNTDHSEKPKMLFNDSHKFESGFINVNILPNESVMLKSLAGSRLGIWVAHGEGKFSLPYEEKRYHIPVKYSCDDYPGNPNGSPFATAALCSKDGRHLAMMPHLERAFYPWQWAYYPPGRKGDEVAPWIEAFVNARKWVEKFKV